MPAHVLRFWETKFTFIKPTKRAGGRRFYRPQDVAILTGVKTLLHERGYTIRGVQKLYADQGIKALTAVKAEPEENGESGFDFNALSDVAIKGLAESTRERFLEIAKDLERAQALLGRHIGLPRS